MTLPDWILRNDARLWRMFARPGQAADLFRRETGQERTPQQVAMVLAAMRKFYALRWDGYGHRRRGDIDDPRGTLWETADAPASRSKP